MLAMAIPSTSLREKVIARKDITCFIFSFLSINDLLIIKNVCKIWSAYSTDLIVWNPKIPDRRLIYCMRNGFRRHGCYYINPQQEKIAKQFANLFKVIELGSTERPYENYKDNITGCGIVQSLHNTRKDVQSLILNHMDLEPIVPLLNHWSGLKHLTMHQNLWTNQQKELIKTFLRQQANTLQSLSFVGDDHCKKQGPDWMRQSIGPFICTEITKDVLHTFKQLQTLQLQNCSIDDQELRKTFENKDLQHSLTKLSLQECRTLTQSSLAKLVNFSSITELRLISISPEQLDGNQLFHILKHLQNLVLLGTPQSFSYQHMKALASHSYCPHLTQFLIGHNYFDEDLNGLQAMIEYSRLSYVEIAEHCPYNFYDIRTILQHIPSLVGISIYPPKAKWKWLSFIDKSDLQACLIHDEAKQFENHYYNKNSMYGPLLFNPNWEKLGSKERLIQLINRIINRYEERNLRNGQVNNKSRRIRYR